MMKLRQESSPLWSLLLAAGMVACGAGSSLDDYSDGVPEVVPSPIKISPDASVHHDGGTDAGQPHDGGTDAGKDAGRDSGSQGGSAGGQAGGAAIGATCTNAANCASGQCLTTVLSLLNFPGGYCSQMGCQNDSDCPTGSGCTLTQCLKTCTRNNECRTAETYQCATAPLGGLGGTGGGSSTAKYCLPSSIASIGGGTQGGTLAGLGGGATGFLAGLGGLLGGLGGAGGN